MEIDDIVKKYVGEFISSESEKFVPATKYTLTANPDDPNASGNHRKNLVQSVEASLRRLKTHYIDLLWVHIWGQHILVRKYFFSNSQS